MDPVTGTSRKQLGANKHRQRLSPQEASLSQALPRHPMKLSISRPGPSPDVPSTDSQTPGLPPEQICQGASALEDPQVGKSRGHLLDHGWPERLQRGQKKSLLLVCPPLPSHATATVSLSRLRSSRGCICLGRSAYRRTQFASSPAVLVPDPR